MRLRHRTLQVGCTLLVGAMLALISSGCATAVEPAITPLPRSMKGYELYSWQEGGSWKFSLLIGTNRQKSLGEIKSAATVLPNLEALRSVLQALPPGEFITWQSAEGLSFPPESVIEQVAQICKDDGLILNVAK